MDDPRRSTKRSAKAYRALRRALPVIFWYKRPFETYLRDALADHPELLVGLNFRDLKRVVADQLVDRLVERGSQYQDVTLRLMVEIASMDRFPDLEKLDDAKVRLQEARAAVADLREWTRQCANRLQEEDRSAAERAAAQQQAAATRNFSNELASLREQLLTMHGMSDAQRRGYEFQEFLDRLFVLLDMEPRLDYSLEREQIDGSLSFDTDDYIVEARWWEGAVGRDHADVFATKVRRKGRNALGLFVSSNGYSQDALDEYSHSTPFLTLDGQDLVYVLE